MKSAKAAKKASPSKKPQKAAKKASKGTISKVFSKVKKAIALKSSAASKKPLAKKADKKPEKRTEAKKPEAKKKILTNPYDTFMGLWKPKNESFEAGLDRLFAEYPAPEKNDALYRFSTVEKIHAQMRKEPTPSVIEEQINERFPRDRAHKMISVLSMKPKTVIRLNVLKADIRGFGLSETARDLKIKRLALSPWAFEIGKPEEAFNHPAYERGLFEFHDEAAQVVSLFANARPGQRILDLSAGDGSNALALSTMMRNKGSLFIYETDTKKLKNFRERAAKAGIDNFRILTDTQIGEVKSLDSVLVSAPSSRVGELASHPDMKWRLHREDLPRIQKLQAALLREGARKLKLGGYLVYATHTINKSENEAQIDHFLRSSHNSYRLVPAFQYFKEWIYPYMKNFYSSEMDEKTLSALGEYDPFFMLIPDVHGCAGTFISIIQRIRIST